MIGTNDLKNRRTRQEVSAAHKEATDEIREAGAQLTVVQLPPVYHPQARAETRARDTEINNEILLERHGATTAKADKITIHRGQIKSDGIHLTNESAEIMAEQITEAIEKSNDANAEENIQITIPNNSYNDPETQDNNTTKEVTTTAQVAGKIIGRGGERIRKLKTLYRVEINTDETDDDHRTFQITGPANNATKVQKMIRDIAREVTDRDQEQEGVAAYTNAPPPRQHKSTELCRFFQKGKCNRGSSCYFLHQSGPADISMETETSATSEEEEPSPVRKITIKPKRDSQHTSTKDRTEETKERQKRKPRSPQRNRKQPNHRSTSDDGTPNARPPKKDSPPQARVTVPQPPKGKQELTTPHPHTPAGTTTDVTAPLGDRTITAPGGTTAPGGITIAPGGTTAPGGITIAPGGTTAPGGITIALGGATTAPGGATTAPAGSTKDATQHHPPGNRTTPAPGPGHRQGTMTEGDQNHQNPTGRDKDAKGKQNPEETIGINPDQAHGQGNATTPGDKPLPREEQTAEMTGDGTAQRPEDRSRTRSPPGEPQTHQRQHRSHDGRELAEAFALFLSRRGTR